MRSPASIVVQTEGLSKVYRVPRKGHHSLSGTFSLVWQVFLSRNEVVPRGYEAFSALEPIDLTMHKGEAVGIIGRNGSGKSTLLQMIAGTLAPTTGQVQVHGRVSALLELGSGFSPDYTGMENIFLNGAILGMSRKSIEAKLDDILGFAEIGEFIHQPIKTYSSGMRVRLAFSVLTAIRPEILILDEALSVGDTFFQSKCSRWLESYVESGGTLLCVSHDMFLLQRLCQRGILLDQGKLVLDGPIAKAANLYLKMHRGDEAPRGAPVARKQLAQGSGSSFQELELRKEERTGTRQLEILAVRTNRDLVEECGVGEPVQFEVEVEAHETIRNCHLGIGFRDRTGQLIAGHHSQFSEESLPVLEAGETYLLRVEITMDLKPRPYLLVVGLGYSHSMEEWEDFDTLWDCAQVHVQGERRFWGIAPIQNRLIECRKAGEIPVPVEAMGKD